jgi:hypothetical protein
MPKSNPILTDVDPATLGDCDDDTALVVLDGLDVSDVLVVEFTSCADTGVTLPKPPSIKVAFDTVLLVQPRVERLSDGSELSLFTLLPETHFPFPHAIFAALAHMLAMF